MSKQAPAVSKPEEKKASKPGDADRFIIPPEIADRPLGGKALLPDSVRKYGDSGGKLIGWLFAVVILTAAVCYGRHQYGKPKVPGRPVVSAGIVPEVEAASPTQQAPNQGYYLVKCYPGKWSSETMGNPMRYFETYQKFKAYPVEGEVEEAGMYGDAEQPEEGSVPFSLNTGENITPAFHVYRPRFKFGKIKKGRTGERVVVIKVVPLP